MRAQSALLLVGIITLATLGSNDVSRRPAPPLVRANSNTERGGVLRGGVLSVALEAKRALWYLNGASRPPQMIEAFAEPGKAPVAPGPLVRAPVGTEIRLSVHNELSNPLTLFVPAVVRGDADRLATDSVLIAPGATASVITRATNPGNYVYRARAPGARGRAKDFGIAGVLAGALVIDTLDAPARARDRIFVVMQTDDSALAACADTSAGNRGRKCQDIAFPARTTINGLAWPNTERMHAAVGDSLHWRVINATDDVHPMHLHGFYYRIDEFGGPQADVQGRPAPGQMVVTQLLTPFSGMSMTWSPDRPGNWLFHCHFAMHLQPDVISAASDDAHLHGMAGLVIGTIVSARPGVQAAREPAATRRLRLIAIEDSATLRTDARMAVPSMHFVLDEDGHRIDAGPDFSPDLGLVRGEPVAITIVNHLREPTSVHWHGIEVQDSYMDGAAGFSGLGKHLAPEIAPGDSFVARFTPPRAGTFMYHAHMHEIEQEMAGLEGALIVRDSGAAASRDDHVFFLKASRVESASAALEINGRTTPDTVVLHVGRPARFRLLNLSTHHLGAAETFRLAALFSDPPVDIREETIVDWRPLAKDGLDLPQAARASRPAQQAISMGETYDFEYTPGEPGMLRLEVVPLGVPGARLRLLIGVPIRVE
jgi:FtsP/CotA-like multicopper oxidase with cupredoxin domain